jgi:short subunit dehydrogenase-like uncharacterized protein
MPKPWMIYGANGYTGELIAREAVNRDLKPVLAGRTAAKLEPLAASLCLQARVFEFRDAAATARNVEGMVLVLNCAGPFSATAAPMMAACLATHAHYLDITGEISVFEHAQTLDAAARAVGIVICPGVGFDVIPTDCVAAALKAALPDATSLALGFDSRSGFSPGTAKTSVEGLAQGGKVRRDGRIISVPLAYKTRRIDFGDGEKLAMTIPWGDVSTAYATTGIPNIDVYIPGSPAMVTRARRARPGAEHHEAAHRKDGQRALCSQARCAAHVRVGRGYECARRQTHGSDQDGQRLQPDSDRRASSCRAFAGQ